MKQPNRFGWSVAIGAMFILMGVLGVLNNIDVINIGSIWNFWPVIFLFIGISKFANATSPFERPEGLFWICLSAYFFVSIFHLGGLHYRDAWPIILIGVGASMAWKALIRTSESPKTKEV